MTGRQAKEILLLYRPGTGDEQNPEVREALELAGKDPELWKWFVEHREFQVKMAAALQSIAAPSDLKQKILENRKIVRGIPWRQPGHRVLAAAAALAFLIGIAAFWLHQPDRDRFDLFRARMVGTALREYRMDVATNDLAQVRQYMETRGAPADFAIPPGLHGIELAGGGFLKWRDNPVSMVCFRKPDQQMMYLFVIRSAALDNPPQKTPTVTTVNELSTVTWSRGENTYVLAGPAENDFLEKYVRPAG